MKKRQVFNKFKKSAFMLSALLVSALALSGCASLAYIGDDYDSKNISSIQTDEAFYFSTYIKDSQTEEISLRLGVAKTPVQEILATYVQITNNSTANDYVFHTKDLEIRANDGTLVETISPSNYLGAYQSSQAGAIASMTQMASGFNNFASIANTYHQLNQATSTMRSNAVSETDNAYRQISAVVEGITQHTINNSAVIKPRETRFFYIFIEDPDSYPIKLEYKDLTYQFMLKKIDPPEQD